MPGDAHSQPPPYSAHNGGDPPPKKTPLPHISDLCARPTDIPLNQSIKHLMELAEHELQQSIASRQFNRPELALKDYIRASVIAVQIIPNHKDYIILKNAPGDPLKRHRALLKDVSTQNGAFEQVKAYIIEDNKASGVRPTALQPSASRTNGVRTIQPAPTSAAAFPAAVNGAAKTKPAVQPKPQSLHGNAIKPKHSRGYSVGSSRADLEGRFASLRGPVPQGQDPRIKTHPIVPPKPAGPRGMPTSPSKLRLSIDQPVPSFPRVPDAIYSPARTSLSGDTPRLPSSAPRGTLPRTSSSASVHSVLGPSQQPTQNTDYFPTAPEASAPHSAENVELPVGNDISVENLFAAMKAMSVLLIDLRERQEYDEGHIMSSSIICVEPSVLSRENISGEDISESLVLSPGQEQSLFDKRAWFDLVVIYDNDSKAIPHTSRNSSDKIIMSLCRALMHLSYDNELKQPPRILKGGIHAWIDLMGTASLQSTNETSLKGTSLPPGQSSMIARRGSRFVSKPLKPDDARAWQGIVKNDVLNFPKMEADFLRRFPGPHMIKESMISHPAERPRYGTSHKGDLNSELPSPPTRPAPAVPRRAHSGLGHKEAAHDSYDGAEAALTVQHSGSRGMKMAEQPTVDRVKLLTGLNNPGNWCYANSTLQMLLASPLFGRILSDSKWKEDFKVPKKKGEKIEHPRLMISIVSNLFHWMSGGTLQTMKAQTLMDYSKHLCRINSYALMFGGNEQQDAQEFMSFLLAEIHDETNSMRDCDGQPDKPDTKNQSLLQAASQYWTSHLRFNRSIVDLYWRGLELSTVKCSACQTTTHTFSPFEWLAVPCPRTGTMTLEQVMGLWHEGNVIDNFKCDSCCCRRRATQSTSLARMPSLLCISFRRFYYDDTFKTPKKSMSTITWDFNNVDFSPYFLAESDRPYTPELQDRAFLGSFKYECYAVIMHQGSSTNSGHYYAFVRDSSTQDPYAWLHCNDEKVSKIRIGSGDYDDWYSRVFKANADTVPYLVFFKRKSVS